MNTTYPDPDDTDPTARDRPDVGEAPVAVRSDDAGDKLSQTEGEEKSSRGSLHEEEAVRSGHEDQGLGDDSHLQVNNHVKLRIVVVFRSGC